MSCQNWIGLELREGRFAIEWPTAIGAESAAEVREILAVIDARLAKLAKEPKAGEREGEG